MKNSQPNFIFTQTHQQTQSSLNYLSNQSVLNLSNDYLHLQTKCTSQNIATLLCINNNCNQKSPFICSNMECNCQTAHQQCIKGNLRFLYKKLNQKINQPHQTIKQIQIIFDKMIDRISDLRDQFLAQIDTKFKYTNLHPLQNNFLQAIKSNQLPQTLHGKMQTIWKLLTQKNKEKLSSYDVLKQKVSQLQTTIDQKCTKISKYIEDQISRLNKNVVLFHDSSLNLGQLESIQKLQGFFGSKIKSTDLLYKASENGFDLLKFYQNCGNQKNLMIVCQTNKGKIIGGYTPLSFKGETDSYVSDPSQKTFIFSLSNNHKFTMKTTNNAIYRVSGQQRICFGGCQFEICNNANRIKKCRSYSLNYYYQNDNYISNNLDSYEKFNGNRDEYFTVNEWQAWKISMDE